MAGVKGRSGGARPNTGGARPGAGRKPNPPQLVDVPVETSSETGHPDSLAFLRQVMANPEVDIKERLRAAISLAQYEHPKVGEGGKKERKKKEADEIAGKPRFAPAAPPKLTAVK